MEAALKIASTQAAMGCVYNLAMNYWIDPHHKGSNLPGVLAFLSCNGFKANSTKIMNYGETKSCALEVIRQFFSVSLIVSHIRGLLTFFQTAPIEQSKKNPKETTRPPLRKVFRSSHHTDSERQFNSRFDAPSNDSTTDATNDSSESRLPLLTSSSDDSLRSLCSSSSSFSSSFTIRIQECPGQAFRADVNALFVVGMIAATYSSLSLWTSIAASQLEVPSAPLQLALFLVLAIELIGRSQRSEHLKNAESVARWTWVVFPLSVVSFAGCGVRGVSFYYLVILLRYLMDMYRTAYRFLTNDPAVNSSVALQCSIQVLFGCLVLPVVIFLSAFLATKKPSKN